MDGDEDLDRALQAVLDPQQQQQEQQQQQQGFGQMDIPHDMQIPQEMEFEEQQHHQQQPFPQEQHQEQPQQQQETSVQLNSNQQEQPLEASSSATTTSTTTALTTTNEPIPNNEPSPKTGEVDSDVVMTEAPPLQELQQQAQDQQQQQQHQQSDEKEPDEAISAVEEPQIAEKEAEKSPKSEEKVTEEEKEVKEEPKNEVIDIDDDDDDEEPAEKEFASTGAQTDNLQKPAGIETGTDSYQPDDAVQSAQTEFPSHPFFVPVGTPMYFPVPTQMTAAPYPLPVITPVPVVTPVFIDTGRNSLRGIKKKLTKLLRKHGQESEDPVESDDSPVEDVEDDDDDDEVKEIKEEVIKEEVLPPDEDFEALIKGERVVAKPLPQCTPDPSISPGPPDLMRNAANLLAGQKRRMDDGRSRSRPRSTRGRGQGHQQRRDSAAAALAAKERSQAAALAAAAAAAVNITNVPKERPDAKHHLKFTYGVNAWKHWVVQKNAELEKARAQGKYMKTFETDILKLRADELIYTLCMFVKEVKKPNGATYTPDSMLYLTLGIQEYLFENGRIDNIFTDIYYEPFTNALHEVVKDFKLPVNELGYFITRVEEEHLWESKQLGAHSPQVLLNTLVYFNAKYFLLTTVEQHKRLSFSHIVKHWKRISNSPGGRVGPGGQMLGQGLKSVVLRYYPPTPAKIKPGKHDDRKCYEQNERNDHPLRCPVKLYEFYLSKCPEASKTRNDIFYLQPERSCVPDSPVWYTCNPLNTHQLDKMLQRLLMIREVQEMMLADSNEN